MSQATLENSKTVRRSLQEKYDLLGYEDIIIWDSYKTTDKKELKIKVMLAVGIQEKPEIPERGTMTAEEYEKAKKIAEKAHKKNMELIDNICTSLWRQAKYTGGELMMSISYVCIVDEESSAVGLGQICTKFSTSPIFRVKKVYATWEAYKVENILPAGIVVAPAKGIFVGKKTEREEWAVKLEEFLSPAAQPEAKAAAATDKVSAGVGLASSAILIGAMVPVVAPIALPLAGAAVVGGVVSSGWSILRSSLNLADRSKHEQSIDLSDAEARGSWLGVAGGSLGLASGAAGQALGAMARNGSNISPFIRFGFNGLNVSVLVVNGLGTINGFVDIFFINDDQPVTAQQVLQLSASLFMFTHSVYNFQTANSIIRSNQDMTIRDVRESLSRNQKRAFDKMSKETIRLKGESTGKADIVRNLKKIPDHKEYFRDMYKVNKQLNEANVKPSFGSDGQMQLNGQPGNTVPTKYTGGELMMSISYVCIVDEESSAVGLGQICTKFSTSPIFRVKKCQKNSSTENCCMIFVDIHGRVYATWEAYKVENILPAGIVVAPAKGIFVGKKTEREEWAVKLEEFLSPAAQPEAKAAAATDKVSAGVGLASSAILIGAMVPVVAPIALPLAGAAVVGGVVSSGWSILRSSLNLADRSKHEQSIDLSDAEARGSWLGVAGGSLGLASGAAGQALGAMARNGSNISPFIRFGFNGLNVSVLVVNGLGTINGFVDIFFINDDQPVTAQQVLQLSASLFMFTHSVYNFQTANSIIRSNQDMTIRDVRESLSRNQKRAFDKMSKETIRLKGESTGKADIVRNLKKIPDHKEYFRDMYKVNKQLNEANVKPSFGSDGQMQLNGQPGNTVPSELRANLKAASTAEVFSSIPAHDPNLGASTKPGQLNLINSHQWSK
uniref:DUF4781 domain-containing protein n=1 Tax=Lutzomyia longipalpis TaxID=7200 RepID=A0A1B0C8P3_LUTLO